MNNQKKKKTSYQSIRYSYFIFWCDFDDFMARASIKQKFIAFVVVLYHLYISYTQEQYQNRCQLVCSDILIYTKNKFCALKLFFFPDILFP
jgi:hypothetical protein